MKALLRSLTGIIAVLPYVTLAVANPAKPTDFKGLVNLTIGIMQNLVVLIFALTFITFMWGVIKGWVIQGGSEEGVENGKKIVFAGIVAFVVMSSVWGILYLLKSSLFGA